MKAKELGYLLVVTLGFVSAVRAQAPILWWEPPIGGASAFGAALGDVDGDGTMDAAWVHLLSPGTILLNDGAGNFSPHPTAAPLPNAAAVAMGDLNGNGHLDLLIGLHLSQCQVWTNNGSGAFYSTGQLMGPSTSRRSVALVDVNGNGHLDAILPSDNATQPSELWVNNGLGTFAFAQTLGSNWNRNVAVGDITGNGAADLVFAANFNNTVWTNNGSGVFHDTGGFVGSGSTYGVALGDLNGNGHLDAFVASAGMFESPWNEVWFNSGSGSFTNSGQMLGNARAFSVILVDVDDDGDLDAVVGNPAGVPNEIWRNNGNGFFTLAPVHFGIANATDIQAADLDGDGDLDYFLAVNANPSEVWLRAPVAQGGPFKDSGQRIGGSQMIAVAPGDFNGDGSLDIAFGAVGQMVGILLNNGLGQFQTAPQKLPQGANVGAIAALDYNHDGHLDLVVGLDQSFLPDTFNRIWLNNGNGLFSPGPALPGVRATTSLVVADLTGNGFPDIVEGNRTTLPLPSDNPTNQIHIQHSAGVWTSMDALGGGWTASLAVGDLDGDGLPDIVVGNKDIPTTVWLNNGATQFVDSGQALFTNVQDVVLADFNGSGALDLFLVSSPRSVLYTNDGSGAFSVLSSNFFTSALFMRAATLDLNGNGYMDLWLGYGSAGATQDRYYLNDGEGTFAGPFLMSKANNNAALATGDFTGNGVVDLFSAGRNGDSQLWVHEVPMGVVEQYAASFGLSGADTLPFADPDDDGVPNVLEYAYNMNPAFPDAHSISDLASATGGLPWITVAVSNEQPRFIADVIQLVNPVEISYLLEVAPTLVFTGAVPAAVGTTPIDGVYERAVYEYVVPGPTNAHFGRFGIQYTP